MEERQNINRAFLNKIIFISVLFGPVAREGSQKSISEFGFTLLHANKIVLRKFSPRCSLLEKPSLCRASSGLWLLPGWDVLEQWPTYRPGTCTEIRDGREHRLEPDLRPPIIPSLQQPFSPSLQHQRNGCRLSQIIWKLVLSHPEHGVRIEDWTHWALNEYFYFQHSQMSPKQCREAGMAAMTCEHK